MSYPNISNNNPSVISCLSKHHTNTVPLLTIPRHCCLFQNLMLPHYQFFSNGSVCYPCFKLFSHFTIFRFLCNISCLLGITQNSKFCRHFRSSPIPSPTYLQFSIIRFLSPPWPQSPALPSLLIICLQYPLRFQHTSNSPTWWPPCPYTAPDAIASFVPNPICCVM